MNHWSLIAQIKLNDIRLKIRWMKSFNKNYISTPEMGV